MKSLEIIPPPKRQEEDPLAGLRKILDKQATPEKPEAKSMTIGRMNEFQRLLEESSLDILGLNIKHDRKSYEKLDFQEFGRYGKKEAVDEMQERAEFENFCREFLNTKDDLDSNTKVKLWERINGIWKMKLEEAFKKLGAELESMGLAKKSLQMSKNFPAQLTEKEEKILSGKNTEEAGYLGETPIKERVRRLAAGLKTLKDFGFDEQRLKELEERFKKVKK